VSAAAATTWRWKFAVLAVAFAVPRLLMAGSPESPTKEESALQACARITADAERLACYDRLASPAARIPASVTPPSAAMSTAAPAAVPPHAAVPPSAATSTAAAAAAAAASAPPPKESFGLYAAEHPQPPVAPALEAAVVAVGTAPSGKMTVQLAGGALWELDTADPLLAVGDTVTLTRAALGSFLMHTPSQRIHRVRRLR